MTDKNFIRFEEEEGNFAVDFNISNAQVDARDELNHIIEIAVRDLAYRDEVRVFVLAISDDNRPTAQEGDISISVQIFENDAIGVGGVVDKEGGDLISRLSFNDVARLSSVRARAQLLEAAWRISNWFLNQNRDKLASALNFLRSGDGDMYGFMEIREHFSSAPEFADALTKKLSADSESL